MATHKITAPSAAQSEVPAAIAGSVPLVRLSEALARSGLTARHDADRGLLVIEPAATTRAAGSAVPADCWRAFQSGRVTP